MQDSLLAINNLSLERGERLLFNDLSVTLNCGEMIQIEGPNGAGKTSLIRTIAGLIEPLAANFYWRQQPVNTAQVYSDEILYLAHKPAIRYPLTPLENLRWYSQIHPQQCKQVTDAELRDALGALGLSNYENEPCSQLSAGQRRRVGLARLAISTAPLWLLDEPFTAVDMAGIHTLATWMQDFASSGGCLVFTTHQKVEFQRQYPRIIDLSELPSVGDSDKATEV